MRPIQSNAFRLGFVIGLAACVFLNYRSYQNNVCPEFIDDCRWLFGVPVPFYEEGGFTHYWGIIWHGLITDVFFAVTASVLVGWFFYLVAQRFIAPQD